MSETLIAWGVTGAGAAAGAVPVAAGATRVSGASS